MSEEIIIKNAPEVEIYRAENHSLRKQMVENRKWIRWAKHILDKEIPKDLAIEAIRLKKEYDDMGRLW